MNTASKKRNGSTGKKAIMVLAILAVGAVGWTFVQAAEEAAPADAKNAQPAAGPGVCPVCGAATSTSAAQDGVLYASGWNNYGQLGDGTITSRATSVAAGGYHNLAVRDGVLYAWGNNGNGQLSTAVGTDNTMPMAVQGLGTGLVTAVAAGENHSLAIQGGVLYAWGSNGYGQVGNDAKGTDSATPVAILWDDMPEIVAIAAGSNSSYALGKDGSLWAWGKNDLGQLGLGDTAESYYATPQQVAAPDGYVFSTIFVGNEHVLATLKPIPEPMSLSLLAAGVVGLLSRRRRK